MRAGRATPTGSRSAARSLLGPGTSPSAILLTHAHPDHEGAARALAGAWGCPILAAPGRARDRARRLRGDGALGRPARPVGDPPGDAGDRRAPARPRCSRAEASPALTRALPADGTIPGMDGWTWIATPGHTPGHVSFVRSDDRVVLTGDALLTLQVNAAGRASSSAARGCRGHRGTRRGIAVPRPRRSRRSPHWSRPSWVADTAGRSAGPRRPRRSSPSRGAWPSPRAEAAGRARPAASGAPVGSSFSALGVSCGRDGPWDPPADRTPTPSRQCDWLTW